MPIYFYSAREEPYGCFSNFSPHPFALDGAWWPTSEHYFQAQKFAGTERCDQIRQARSPMIAARMGRSRKYPLRPDWEQAKDTLMLQAVLKKFETHADIRAVLLGTVSETIIENASHDYYWGCGADGSGQNKLGQTLMQVRAILPEHQANQ
jgi:N-glycosidase YbiA